MMRACVFGSAHGLRRRFLRLHSALCLSLSPLVFNAAVGPPALKFLPVCLCVFVCVVVFFPWRWWTTSGTRRPAGWPDSDLGPCTLSRWVSRLRCRCPTVIPNPVCKRCVFSFWSRCAATPWASTALAKLGSGASGATPPLRRRPTMVSSDTRMHKHTRCQGPNLQFRLWSCHLSNFAKKKKKMAGIFNLS